MEQCDWCYSPFVYGYMLKVGYDEETKLDIVKMYCSIKCVKEDTE